MKKKPETNSSCLVITFIIFIIFPSLFILDNVITWISDMLSPTSENLPTPTVEISRFDDISIVSLNLGSVVFADHFDEPIDESIWYTHPDLSSSHDGTTLVIPSEYPFASMAYEDKFLSGHNRWLLELRLKILGQDSYMKWGISDWDTVVEFVLNNGKLSVHQRDEWSNKSGVIEVISGISLNVWHSYLLEFDEYSSRFFVDGLMVAEFPYGPFESRKWIVSLSARKEEDGEYKDAIVLDYVVLVRTSIPQEVSIGHIQRFQEIQENIERGEVSKADVYEEMDHILVEVGKEGFTWLVRRMPVYDTEIGQWTTLDNFSRGLISDYEINPETRFGSDPVGTGVELMFGEYTTDDMIEWLGLDDLGQ